jgi:hypothetical protein
MKKARMRKALSIAKKLKGAVKPNNITIDEIIEEQKLMHKERMFNSQRLKK